MKQTKVNIVKDKLESLELNEEFHIPDFVNKHWGECDYFTTRSFDVALANAKKLIPERKFKRSKKSIIRIN